MSVNQGGVSELRSVWIKTAEQRLFHELEAEYGFPRATCRSLAQLMHEFMKELREQGIEVPTRGSIQDISPTFTGDVLNLMKNGG